MIMIAHDAGKLKHEYTVMPGPPVDWAQSGFCRQDNKCPFILTCMWSGNVSGYPEL